MTQPYIDYKKLLQGYYEARYLPKDFSPERDVPDFAFNVLNPLGLLYRPVVDEHHLETEGKKPIWPGGKSFAVCLTHDVDAVSSYSFQQSLRIRCSQLSHTTSPSKNIKNLLGFGIDLLRSVRQYGQKDPLHCYERWLEVEEKVCAHSTFFFWPGLSTVSKRHHSDCMYELSDSVVFDNQKCSIAEMMQEIDRRGWEIGLHASWYSFDDIDELKRQKEAIEKVLDHEITSIRQHCLHYDIRVTPRVHSEAGFKYDSTLGFNDNVGFRFGTCYPWYLSDLRGENRLPIMEIPLIMQDGAMLNPTKGMRLDEERAFEYVIQMVRQVERVGGVLTLLWHPNHIIDEPWWNLYQHTLDYLNEKNVWFACIKEIGKFSENEQR